MRERDRIGLDRFDFGDYMASEKLPRNTTIEHDRRPHHQTPKLCKVVDRVTASGVSIPSPVSPSPSAEAVRDYKRSRWARPCGEFRPLASKGTAKWTA